jgi:hypothetical protein
MMSRQKWAGFIALLLFPASFLFGQTSGTVLGTVQDVSGGVVINATISITNVARDANHSHQRERQLRHTFSTPRQLPGNGGGGGL